MVLMYISIVILYIGTVTAQTALKCDWDSRCRCLTAPDGMEVTCTGSDVTDVPRTIPSSTTKLSLSGTGIKWIPSGAFSSLPHLVGLFIRDNAAGACELESIERGAFDNMTNLRTIGLIGCTKLMNLSAGVLGTFEKLDNVHIYRSGLISVPDLSLFRTINREFNGSLTEMDLHRNQIRKIPTYAFSGLSIAVIVLEENKIRKVDRHAFKNATIVRLSLSNNPDLTDIEENAFDGIKRLENLDLSNTKIARLPTKGLSEIRQLILKKTPYLRQFPSVLQFNKIEIAELHYPHHCCAFEKPEKQSPDAWKEKVREEQKKLDEKCKQKSTVPPVTTFIIPHIIPHIKIPPQDPVTLHPLRLDLAFPEHDDQHPIKFGGDHPKSFIPSMNVTEEDFGHHFPPIIEQPVLPPENPNIPIDQFSNGGKWVPSVPVKNVTVTIKCGKIHISNRVVKCSPKPDSFNPCEDVMGYMWLRITVWFVLLAALLGNSVVLLVLITSRGKFSVPKFLMCNLAFADFFMGIYLMLLASIDAHTLGEYFNYAIQWQNEGGCQAAGFLSVFSSELSVFTLTILTLERWYAISHAIHLNKRLKLRHAIFLMVMGFVFATILATLPLVGVSGYGNVSICLPMKVENNIDKGYVVSLLLMNGLMFLAICSCYVNMYVKVKGSVATARSNDATIAKRMALLVFTNFACWAPIAFFGLTASAGLTLIDITHSKILLVFFYPLNSCANPFLYAILTKQFRKDVFLLLGKYGICVEKANKYRATYTSRTMSQSRGNRELALHGINRHSESVLTNLAESNLGPRHSLNGTPKVHPRHHVPESQPFIERSHLDRATEFANRDLQIKDNGLAGEEITGSGWCSTGREVVTTFTVKDGGDRPPYVRSVSGYINSSRKSSTKYTRFQRSVDTSLSTSTDTTCVSDMSHANDDIWQIVETDDDCAPSSSKDNAVNRARFEADESQDSTLSKHSYGKQDEVYIGVGKEDDDINKDRVSKRDLEAGPEFAADNGPETDDATTSTGLEVKALFPHNDGDIIGNKEGGVTQSVPGIRDCDNEITTLV